MANGKHGHRWAYFHFDTTTLEVMQCCKSEDCHIYKTISACTARMHAFLPDGHIVTVKEGKPTKKELAVHIDALGAYMKKVKETVNVN